MWWFHRFSWLKTTKTSVKSIVRMLERGFELNMMEASLLGNMGCTITVPFTNEMVGVWVVGFQVWPSIGSTSFINEDPMVYNM
jgi:hypothetical protein